MDIKLETNDPLKSLVLQNIEKYDLNEGSVQGSESDYSVYYGADLLVCSDWLNFHTHINIPKHHLHDAITDLTSMSQGVPCDAVIKEEHEISYVGFRINPLGHVTVFGGVHDTGGGQSVTFSFDTDQTVLPKLISDLSRVLNL